MSQKYGTSCRRLQALAKATQRWSRESVHVHFDPRELLPQDLIDGNSQAVPSAHGVRSVLDLSEKEREQGGCLYCRESSRNQNLRVQRVGSRRRLEKLGMPLAGCFGDIGDGKSLSPDKRPQLIRAFARARELKLPLVAPCFSRLLRSAEYHASQNPMARPSVNELNELLKLAAGVPIVTLNDADATPPEDEAFLRDLAAEVGRRPVGRPRRREYGYSSRRRTAWLARWQQLRAEGLSYRAIAWATVEEEGTSVSPETIRKWLSLAGAT